MKEIDLCPIPFKVCPNCGTRWERRDTFLSDPCVCLRGYQMLGKDLIAGLFLFVHDTESCGTSMAIEASEFADLHEGPIFEQQLHGTDRCPGHCLNEDSLEPCRERCECAFVRDVLDRVRNWPKHRELVNI